MPALKLINPATTEYSLLSFSTYSRMFFAIRGGAILANLASEETLIAKSPKSAFFGRSVESEPLVYSFISPNLLSLIAFLIAVSISFKK